MFIPLLLKSTLCLAVLYGFYQVFLRGIKTFMFNRFYLLFSLVFSMVIPFVSIPFSVNIPLAGPVNQTQAMTIEFVKNTMPKPEQTHEFSFYNLFIFLYLIISSIMLLRFLFNLLQMIRLVRRSEKVCIHRQHFVLTEVKTLPYSFFQYVFVNRFDFESGEIQSELLIHEQAHSNQLHSLDVMFIELLNVIFWFQPFLWVYKRAMKLNHEYLADQRVLQNHEVDDFLKTLLNIVFRNNSTYLASNFNYSLTKKRILMMTSNKKVNRAVFRKIAAVPVFVFLVISIGFSQKIARTDSLMNYQNQWWFPILTKHNLEMKPFNNFDKVFEMGSENSIENRVVTLKDAVFIFRNKEFYYILKSPLAYHDLDANKITCEDGSWEKFRFDDKSTNPLERISFKGLQLKFKKDGYTFESKFMGVEGISDIKRDR